MHITTSKWVDFLAKLFLLNGQFSRRGIPVIVFSDNGPPFLSEDFKYFMKTWEISHHTSSPRYPQSNGRMENSVKVVKNMMSKDIEDHQDPFLALLDWKPHDSLRLL